METEINKISIIIPVYNAESYIDRCIKSVTEQSGSGFDIGSISYGW